MTLSFDHLFEISPSNLLVVDRELRCVAVNAAYCRATCTEREALVGRKLFDVFPRVPVNAQSGATAEVRRAFERVFETGREQVLPRLAHRGLSRTASGDVVEVDRVWSAVHSPIFGADGGVLYAMQYAQDVTPAGEEATSDAALDALARAESVITTLGESRAELLRLFHQWPGFVCFLKGPDHVFELTNPVYDELVGHRAKAGMPMRVALPETIEGGWIARLDHVYATGEPFVARRRRGVLQRDGAPSEHFFDVVYQPVRGRAGEVTGVIISGYDVTLAERARDVQAELQRRNEEAYAEVERVSRERSFVMDMLPELVWTASPDGRLTYVSSRSVDFFGVSPETLLGDGWGSVVHPSELASVLERWKHSLATGDGYEVEFRLRGPDGAYRSHRSAARAYRGPDGAIVKWIGSVTNVDDMVRLAEERDRSIRELRAQKGDLERFADVTSHDLKAPLRAIAKLAEWIGEDVQGKVSPETDENVRLLRDRAQKAISLVDAVLHYARAGGKPHDHAEIDVNQLVRESLSMLAPEPRHRVTLPEGALRVWVSRTALQQILLNLLGNALRFAREDQPRIAVETAIEGGVLRLAVSDNGPGIPESSVPQVLAPFRTLSAPQSGTGLGLSIVHRLVQTQDGTLRIGQGALGGAEVVVTLPARRDTKGLSA